MRQSKMQFFKDGVEKQKRPDITMDLRRVDIKKIEKWSIGQRIMMKAFLEECKSKLEAFIKELD